MKLIILLVVVFGAIVGGILFARKNPNKVNQSVTEAEALEKKAVDTVKKI